MSSMADMATAFLERQEDELSVLKAILLDDVEDLRSGDAWKVSCYTPVNDSLSIITIPHISSCFDSL